MQTQQNCSQNIKNKNTYRLLEGKKSQYQNFNGKEKKIWKKKNEKNDIQFCP